MQAVMAIPSGIGGSLTRPVAGVPLLVRVLGTAIRAGVDELVLCCPSDLDPFLYDFCIAAPSLARLRITRIDGFAFDPRKHSHWTRILALLNGDFLWLPWNFVTSARQLSALSVAPCLPISWQSPVRLTRDLLSRSPRAGVTAGPVVEGVWIRQSRDVGVAERFLVRHSGKATDGFYSNLNRKLSRPAVRLLTHTPVTPNMVTIAGLLVGVGSAIAYARGTYAGYVLGAVLFFICGLIDEMDGMLARLKFQESAFGTWFEGYVDNATYLLLFSGITVGLYRQAGRSVALWGAALLVGCVLSFVAVAIQRRLVTSPDRPHEYSVRMNHLMDSDPNPVSRIARQIHIFIKKGVAIHYVLLFTVAGALPILFGLASVSANLTWILVSWFTWRINHERRSTSLQSAF